LTLNITADFPMAARAYVNLHEETVGPIDGVVVADPFAVAALLRVAGPVEVGGFGVLDADTVVDYVTNLAYADFDDRVERQEVLGEVAGVALEGFLARGGEDPQGALAALGDAVAGGHLLLYSADAELQALLEEAGIAGALPSGDGDVFVPVVNSSSNAKIDYYLRSEAVYDVVLDQNGVVHGRAEVVLRNEAPTTGEPRYVIGPNVRGLEAGTNRFVFSLYCGQDCDVTGVDVDGELPPRAGIETELGLGVVTIPGVEIPSGATRTLRFAWSSPEGWTGDPGAVTYRLHSRQQPLVRGSSLTVRVTAPPGMEVSRAPEGAERVGDQIVFTSQEPGPRIHEVRFVQPDGARAWTRLRTLVRSPMSE
jgi:hypothetical protein